MPACHIQTEKLEKRFSVDLFRFYKGNFIMRKLVIGLALASTALASPALARDGQWYVEVGGGPMIVEDLNFDINSGTDSLKADLDKGFDFGGTVGYDFGAFRLETEASYRKADINSITAGTTGVAGSTVSGTYAADGDVNALSFMLNGLFDFGADDGIQGFVGGGIGVARVDINTGAFQNFRTYDDSGSGLAWQALAGVRAPLNDSWDVGLRYRFFNAPNVGLVDFAGRDSETKLTSHSILGTLTYNFGGEAPPPPPPPPAPVVTPPPPPPPVVAAPPPPPCNKGPYIVFFGWDQSDITPEAATILDNAVSAYRNCGTAAVMLAGHTDTSGTIRYNEGLAMRRNASVTEYLSGRGISGDRVSSEAFGETQLRVPTADGVRELQNRRVEVTYGPNAGM